MERKEYLTRGEKAADFLIGFVGFFALNAIIVLIVSYGQEETKGLAYDISIAARTAWPWAINIGSFVFFAWWRLWIAIGALFALGVLLVVPILAGVCFVVACLAILITIQLLVASPGH